MKISWIGEIFIGHLGVFEDLELVKLHRGERQLRYDISSVEHHFAGFAREAEDEMSAAGEAVGVD